jgi:DNA-binding response OmpR family regulator
MNARTAIIEDETEIRESVAAMLSTIGLQAESFADAGQFLASVEAGAAYDLCIVDINLPGMRGDDMLVELGRNRRARDTVILFLSGLEAEELEMARTRLSAFFPLVAYSCKPVDAGSLLQRVESLIARKPAC